MVLYNRIKSVSHKQDATMQDITLMNLLSYMMFKKLWKQYFKKKTFMYKKFDSDSSGSNNRL